MDGHLGWQLFLQFVLIALNAIFACAEIAAITINDLRLEKLAAGGDARAMRLRRLMDQPARFLATIQVAITLSAFSGAPLRRHFAASDHRLGGFPGRGVAPS